MRYEVQTNMHGGWANVWKTQRGSIVHPATFPSRNLAEAALLNHVAETHKAFLRGDMAAPHEVEMFRVVRRTGNEKLRRNHTTVVCDLVPMDSIGFAARAVFKASDGKTRYRIP